MHPEVKLLQVMYPLSGTDQINHIGLSLTLS